MSLISSANLTYSAIRSVAIARALRPLHTRFSRCPFPNCNRLTPVPLHTPFPALRITRNAVKVGTGPLQCVMLWPKWSIQASGITPFIASHVDCKISRMRSALPCTPSHLGQLDFLYAVSNASRHGPYLSKMLINLNAGSWATNNVISRPCWLRVQQEAHGSTSKVYRLTKPTNPNKVIEKTYLRFPRGVVRHDTFHDIHESSRNILADVLS